MLYRKHSTHCSCKLPEGILCHTVKALNSENDFRGWQCMVSHIMITNGTVSDRTGNPLSITKTAPMLKKEFFKGDSKDNTDTPAPYTIWSRFHSSFWRKEQLRQVKLQPTNTTTLTVRPAPQNDWSCRWWISKCSSNTANVDDGTPTGLLGYSSVAYFKSAVFNECASFNSMLITTVLHYCLIPGSVH